TARAAAESPSGGRRRYLGGTVWTITEGLLRGQTLILGIIRASGIVARVFGRVSERPKVKHSKCFVRQPRTEGSNPSATAEQEALTSLQYHGLQDNTCAFWRRVIGFVRPIRGGCRCHLDS